MAQKVKAIATEPKNLVQPWDLRDGRENNSHKVILGLPHMHTHKPWMGKFQNIEKTHFLTFEIASFCVL